MWGTSFVGPHDAIEQKSYIMSLRILCLLTPRKPMQHDQRFPWYTGWPDMLVVKNKNSKLAICSYTYTILSKKTLFCWAREIYYAHWCEAGNMQAISLWWACWNWYAFLEIKAPLKIHCEQRKLFWIPIEIIPGTVSKSKKKITTALNISHTIEVRVLERGL